MPRKPTGDDATKNLKPEDETQRAKKGRKIGLLPMAKVFEDFRRIVRGKKRQRGCPRPGTSIIIPPVVSIDQPLPSSAGRTLIEQFGQL
jgi:hypothetical protein